MKPAVVYDGVVLSPGPLSEKQLTTQQLITNLIDAISVAQRQSKTKNPCSEVKLDTVVGESIFYCISYVVFPPDTPLALNINNLVRIQVPYWALVRLE